VIRLFLLGIVVVIVSVVMLVSLWLIFYLTRTFRQLLFVSHEYIAQQYRLWRQGYKAKQAEKGVPDFLRLANQRMQNIDRLVLRLDSEWQQQLHLILGYAHELVQKGVARPEQGVIIRSFYTVTLKALESFIQALLDMQETMHADDEEKARQNIDLLMNDIYKYRARLESKKRFDFHVMMDVIKHRLGK